MDTRFRELCEAAAEEWQVPALTAAVDIGGAVQVAAVGCEPGTRFLIASVTKPATALLAASLLDLEAPTGVWPDDVRVRHLLAHTSGYDCELRDGDNARFGAGDDALARCARELPGVRRLLPADDLWSYANTGYWLAGHLAAERAGTSYEEALRERVLRPAGLGDTSFAEPDVAGTGEEVKPGPYPRSRRPSGGLTAPVEDVLRLGRRLLAPDAAPLATVRGKPVGGVYGLGLAGERVGRFEVWGHGGSYGGFQSSLLTVPARGAVFAGLSNSSVGGRALRILEDAFLELVAGEPRRVPDTVALAPEALEGFAGTYEHSGGRYAVAAAGAGLRVGSEGETYEARAIGERTFEVATGDGAGDRFDFPRDGLARFGSRIAERVA